MDRDKVIGLAMAILLIGVVAAFSFRRQPDPVEQVPELHDPALADRGFEDRVVTPYVTGIEPIESTAVAHHNAPTVKSPRSPVVDNVWNEPLPDFLDKKLQSDVPVPKVPSEVAPAVTRLKAETKEGTIPIVEEVAVVTRDRAAIRTDPVPIQPESAPPHDQSVRKVPIPSHNAAWEIATPRSKSPTGGKPDPAGIARERFHVVEKGDTLSGLAIKYLGSPTKFTDIFEANRDILKTPDDLRVGMRLKIPMPALKIAPEETIPSRFDPEADQHTADASSGTQPGNSPAAAGSSKVHSPTQATPASPEHSAPKGKFVPASRSPFQPRGGSVDDVSSGLNSSALGQTVSRTLTQVLPPELAGLTASAQTGSIADAILPSPATSNAGERMHQVRQGDSLESIALEVYGERGAAAQIFQANREKLKNIDDIRAGMTLALP